jgi:hypothetical protein
MIKLKFKQMKTKINILIIAILLILFQSCEQDKMPNLPDDLSVSAIPVLTAGQDTIFNLGSIKNISTTFSFDVKGEATEAYILISYNQNQPQLYEAINEWPADIEISTTKIISSLNTAIDTAGAIQMDDKFTFTADLVTPEGQRLKGTNQLGYEGYSPALRLEMDRKHALTYLVACPSDLAGAYRVVSNATSTDELAEPNPLTDFEYTVTITDLGNRQYRISDIFGGVFIHWYSKYQYELKTPGNFTDECGSFSGTWNDLLGWKVTYTGNIDAETGIIILSLVHEQGDEINSVLTPQ